MMTIAFEEFKRLRGPDYSTLERKNFEVADTIDTFVSGMRIPEIMHLLTREKSPLDSYGPARLFDGVLAYALMSIQTYITASLLSRQEASLLLNLSESLQGLYVNSNENVQEKFDVIIENLSSWLNFRDSWSNQKSAEALRTALYSSMKVFETKQRTQTQFARETHTGGAIIYKMDFTEIKRKLSVLLNKIETDTDMRVAVPLERGVSTIDVSPKIDSDSVSDKFKSFLISHTEGHIGFKDSDVRQAAERAAARYKEWYRGDATGRRASYCFEHRFHTINGPRKAVALIAKLNHQSLEQMQETINDFLRDPKTGYKQNSFTSYLLDELTKLPNSPWSGLSPNDKGLYDRASIPAANSLTMKGPS